jgi:hypothetical protein
VEVVPRKQEETAPQTQVAMAALAFLQALLELQRPMQAAAAAQVAQLVAAEDLAAAVQVLAVHKRWQEAAQTGLAAVAVAQEVIPQPQELLAAAATAS